jgi:putative addiction module CopG family antidote
MGYALAREQQRYIARLVKSGRYNNQSEVVREAIRRLERALSEGSRALPGIPLRISLRKRMRSRTGSTANVRDPQERSPYQAEVRTRWRAC